MNAPAAALLQRVLVPLSGAAVVFLVATALLFSIAMVNDHNLDEPAVPIWLMVAATVLLLFAPGLGWPSNKSIPLLAIAVIVAMTASLAIYVEVWRASCPSCTVGHDDARGQAYSNVWLLVAVSGAIAAGITLVGAAVGEAFSYIIRRQGQS